MLSKTNTVRLLCGLNVGLLFSMSPALAQAGAPSPEAQPAAAPASVPAPNAAPVSAAPAGAAPGMAEIVVTANKRQENINKVGLTVAAISGDTFKQKQISSLADIAAQVPGLSYTNSGSNTPVYTLRGVGFYEATLGAYPDVSTYIDEAPLPFPVLTTLTAFDLERVEVLKGPQGTLFGNNATGGAINYIAAKPTDHFTAGATVGYGRFNDVTGEAYVSGPIADGLTARLSGRVEHADGWQHGYTFDGKTGDTRQYAGRLLIDWKASDRLRFQVNLNAWKDGGQPQAVQFIQYRPNFPGSTSVVSTYPTAPADPRAADFSENVDPHLNNRLYQGVLRGDYDITDDITLTSLTSYVHYKQNMAYDGDGVTYNDFDVPEFLGKVTSFSQEVRLANSPHDRLRWVVGGNFSRDKAADFYELLYPDSTVFSGAGIFNSTFNSSQVMKNYAGFANAEYDLGQLTFKGGVRYTQADRRASSCFAGLPADAAEFSGLYQFLSNSLRAEHGLPPIAPPDGTGCLTLNTTGIDGAAPDYLPGQYRGTLNEHNVSWKAGVDWKPRPGLLLYANVTKGYKAGSFPSAAAATTAQLLPVKQESVLSYEGGFKATLLGGTLQLNGAGFYYDYRDKQLRSKLIDPIFGVVGALVNIPKSSVKGGEIEINVRPTRYFSAHANAVYLDATIDKFTGISGEGVAGNFAGDKVPYAPKIQVSAGFDATQPLDERLQLFAGADVNFRSDTTAIIAGSDAYKINSYATLDLRAGIKDADDKWRFSIWGKNVTNSYYWTNVASNYDTVARYAGRPATYGASFSFKFM